MKKNNADSNKLIRGEIPVRSFVVTAFICSRKNKKGEYLIIRRNSGYLHNVWQMVSGKIEKGETGWQAALREIREETGIIPDELYSTDRVELFYEHNQNCINLCPVFVAFVERDVKVTLSGEHNDYKWIRPKDAHNFFAFDQQVEMINYIERFFVKKVSCNFLKINF